MQDATSKRDWVSHWLGQLAFQSASRPLWTLSLAGLLTCLALISAATRLEFQTSRLALLSPKTAYNQRWLAYLDRFGREDDAVIIVSHDDPKVVAAALTTVGTRLQGDSALSDVLFRQSVGNVASKALYLMPPDQLQQLGKLLQNCSLLLGSTAPGQPVAPVSYANNSQAFSAHTIQTLLAGIAQAQAGIAQVRESVPAEGPLLLEDNGTLGLCLVRMPHIDDQPTQAREIIGRLKEHLQVLQPQYPEVHFGMTGMPILEWDESQSTQRDMQKATLLSLGGVALIMVFGFGSWRIPCVAVVCLAIGLIWTVGLATLVVGHLNLFSVAFGAIIAGLGIDYAIHLLSRLRTGDDMDRHVDELPRALAEAVAHCGKGIVTGAVTTAAAFAVAVLTPFKGMTELGVICALGTLACLVVTLGVLPAFIVLQARCLPKFEPAPWNSWLGVLHARFMNLLERLNQSNLKYRTPMLISTTVATLYAVTQIPQLYYDHNLLNLQAHDAPSVQAEHELTSRTAHSAWFAVSMAKSPAAAHALHAKFLRLPSVARVEEIGGVIATTNHPQLKELVTFCQAQALRLTEQVDGYSQVQSASGTGAPGTAIVPANYQFIMNLHEQLKQQVRELAQSIVVIADSQSPRLVDFPENVRARMASVEGESYLLRIFAKEDLWNRDNLKQFVRDLESVDPRVTGHPIQTWYASGELEKSYYQAGIYAVLTVSALLMLDLQSVRLVVLALIPVSLSFIQLCAWLVAMGIPFNAANMIVLPLIIGIGIDDGVHVMHDFAHRGTKRFTISGSTTLAVLLTSLTTMVGFGCMAIADHRGLQSLGIVLLTGVGLCWLHSWFTLPAILSFFGPAAVGEREQVVAQVNSTVTFHSTDDSRVTSERTPAHASPALGAIPVVMSLPDYPELYLNS